MRITGGLLHEYMACERAAWYSYRRVSFENELVMLGKMMHQNSYKGEVKNIFMDNISLDFIKNENGEVWIYEVKKSSKMIEAAKMQLLFYLKWLKDRGVNAKGKIAVPKEKIQIEVMLKDNEEQELTKVINEMETVISRAKPPRARWKKICEKCAYAELCWA